MYAHQYFLSQRRAINILVTLAGDLKDVERRVKSIADGGHRSAASSEAGLVDKATEHRRATLLRQILKNG
ncbi:hypothetical protein BV133_3506 [Blastochloris viridis]|uniref:Uncharacterized protein n=1 Tax=Blastochloris viridis TaxID=1079 RepID=A0A182D6K1_BLAVI|nr:hypothetical protein BV133_3506 [Blastochloris viridis]